MTHAAADCVAWRGWAPRSQATIQKIAPAYGTQRMSTMHTALCSPCTDVSGRFITSVATRDCGLWGDASCGAVALAVTM